MQQSELLLVGRIEMRRPLRRSQLRRLHRHHREAGFEEIEYVDVEGARDELRGTLARLFGIGVRGRVGGREDASKARIVIGVARIRGQRLRYFENVLERAAEIVDHDDRALTVSEAPKLSSHADFPNEKGG